MRLLSLAVSLAIVVLALAFPMGSDLVVVSAFLALVLAELGSVPAAPRNRPRWTSVSIAFPAVGAVLLVAMQFAFGGASLGTLALGLIALTASCALGLAATVFAVARNERWIAMQVVGFLVNFAVVGAFGLGLLADVLRFG